MDPLDNVTVKSRYYCSRCKQLTSGCFCNEIVVQVTRARTVFLQHPREAKNPLGTARMAHLSLPRSTLLVGVDFAENPEFQRLLAQTRDSSVALFVSPEARDVQELKDWRGPLTVWIIDGTWWQARKIWRQNPALRQMPVFRIHPRQPSQYQIRSEPAPHCLSTVEAVRELLDAVDGGTQDHQSMLAPFRSMVGRQVGFAQSTGRQPRRRLYSRPAKRFSMSPWLVGQMERALVFYVEGNGWPASMQPRPDTELLQWMAVRPATGEKLGVFVRPSLGLSPTALANLQLTTQQVQQAMEVEEFRGRHRKFVRPDDVWCGWGHFSMNLLANAGIELPMIDAGDTAASANMRWRYVDLKEVCSRFLHRRLGRIEETYQLMGSPRISPTFPGRGGARLAMLEAIFRQLAQNVEAEELAA